MPAWKLYWLEVYAPSENCFIIAKTKRSAISFDAHQCRYNYQDAAAKLVVPIPKELEQAALQKHEQSTEKLKHVKNNHEKTNAIDHIWPGYAQDWLLDALGAKMFFLEGRETVYLNGKHYSTGSIDDLVKPARGHQASKECVSSISDFLTKVQELPPGNWLYRGQQDAIWKLECSMQRYFSSGILKGNRTDYEKKLLEQFKLKAIPYLEYNKIPGNDWEWMVLAQHYGLPTRLLDWTRNPLCSLFFAIWGNKGDRDGIVHVYNHGRESVNFIDHPDPFNINKIEVFNPPHISRRVAVQNSIFTVEPDTYSETSKSKNALVKSWFVPASHVNKIRLELDAVGINESTLFPGLESICRDLKEPLDKRII